jgi:hypothetical protein
MQQPTFIPPNGYILTDWDMNKAWRATALAYMQREKKDQVTHENGLTYTYEQIRDAVLGYPLFPEPEKLILK